MTRRAADGDDGDRLAWWASIVGFCAVILVAQPHGQEAVALPALEQETQRTSQSPNRITSVWWMPEQLWQARLLENPALGQQQGEFVLTLFRQYTMIAVLDGQIGPVGALTFKDREAVLASTTIKDARGTSYAPLAESAVDADTKVLLQMLKPLLASMGPMGENLQFVLFPAKSADGRPIAEAVSEGFFSVIVAGTELKYKLPLASVLSPKFDSKSGERFPGNYSYNPFTGSRLVAESPLAQADVRGWQKTQWGMSTDAVVAATGQPLGTTTNIRRPPDATCYAGPFDEGQWLGTRTVCFVATGGLVSVTLDIVNTTFVSVFDPLKARYGAPVSRNQYPANMISETATWQFPSTEITCNYVGFSTGSVQVIYQPRRPSR